MQKQEQTNPPSESSGKTSIAKEILGPLRTKSFWIRFARGLFLEVARSFFSALANVFGSHAASSFSDSGIKPTFQPQAPTQPSLAERAWGGKAPTFGGQSYPTQEYKPPGNFPVPVSREEPNRAFPGFLEPK